MDQRVHDLIEEVRSTGVQAELMERILTLHSEVGDDESRSALITLFTVSSRAFEAEVLRCGGDPATLIETRKAGVRLMCTQESLLSDATVNHAKLASVVQR